MSIYDVESIIEAWRLEKMTSEQAIGKILLVVKEIDARLCEIERRIHPPGPRASRMRRLQR